MKKSLLAMAATLAMTALPGKPTLVLGVKKTF